MQAVAWAAWSAPAGGSLSDTVQARYLQSLLPLPESSFIRGRSPLFRGFNYIEFLLPFLWILGIWPFCFPESDSLGWYGRKSSFGKKLPCFFCFQQKRLSDTSHSWQEVCTAWPAKADYSCLGVYQSRIAKEGDADHSSPCPLARKISGNTVEIGAASGNICYTIFLSFCKAHTTTVALVLKLP